MKNEIKNINKIKQIEENKKQINYDFIIKILKDNIGILIDEFLITNMNQKVTKYNADSFTRWAILSLQKSEEEIIKEFNKKNN